MRLDHPGLPAEDACLETPHRWGSFENWGTIQVEGLPPIIGLFNPDRRETYMHRFPRDIPTLEGERSVLYDHFEEQRIGGRR